METSSGLEDVDCLDEVQRVTGLTQSSLSRRVDLPIRPFEHIFASSSGAIGKSKFDESTNFSKGKLAPQSSGISKEMCCATTKSSMLGAPPLPYLGPGKPDVKAHYNFRLDVDADRLYEMVDGALYSYGVNQTFDAQKFRWHGNYSKSVCGFQFHLHVYHDAVADHKDAYVLEMRRLSGDVMELASFYRDLVSSLTSQANFREGPEGSGVQLSRGNSQGSSFGLLDDSSETTTRCDETASLYPAVSNFSTLESDLSEVSGGGGGHGFWGGGEEGGSSWGGALGSEGSTEVSPSPSLPLAADAKSKERDAARTEAIRRLADMCISDDECQRAAGVRQLAQLSYAESARSQLCDAGAVEVLAMEVTRDDSFAENRRRAALALVHLTELPAGVEAALDQYFVRALFKYAAAQTVNEVELARDSALIIFNLINCDASHFVKTMGVGVLSELRQWLSMPVNDASLSLHKISIKECLDSCSRKTLEGLEA